MRKLSQAHNWRGAAVSLSSELQGAAARLAAVLLAAFTAPTLAYAAQCAERPGALDFLGRAPDNQSSYWIAATNPGSYRLSAPGVPEIDTWSAPSNAVRISVSPVAKNDANGIDDLDRLKTDGSFDCLLHTRNQTNPLLPPTWRPPARPMLPVAVGPEVPDRPVVIARQGRRDEVTDGRIFQYCLAERFDLTGAAKPVLINGCIELFQALRQAPLTPGRDVVEDSVWNAWSDISHLRSDDHRGIAEVRERTGTFSLGGRRQRDQNVLTMSGESTESPYSLALNAQGDYPVADNAVLRPKINVSYLRDDTRDYLLKWPALGVLAKVLANGRNTDTGQFQARVELNTTLTAANGALTVACGEAGAINNYPREQSSMYPRWQDLLRGGFRLRYGTNVQFDGSARDQSLGVSELSVWDARLFASYA
jgi:hypothetical protein